MCHVILQDPEYKLFLNTMEKKIQTKTTTTAVIKLSLKYYPMSEGNTCLAESNLEILPSA